MKPIQIVAIFVICAAMLMSGCVDPVEDVHGDHQTTEATPSPTDEKWVAYYSPVYKTVTHSDPVYKTVIRSDPVYTTLATYELSDASLLGDEVYTMSNVYDIDFSYSGTDTWGNSEYTVVVYYYSGSYDNPMYTILYQIDEWQSYTSDVLIGYDTYTEEVLTGYDTYTEEVFSHYETLYR